MNESFLAEGQEKQLLKPADVARLLNISRSFAYCLLNSGKIPSIRINKSLRVDPMDLDQFINEQKLLSTS